MVLHESGEDYLEAILVLRQEKGSVRSIDVAQHLGFSKPSVSRAMSILRANGYIEMEKAGACRGPQMFWAFRACSSTSP